MLNPSKDEIDDAFRDIEWARNAPARYATATRKIQALRETAYATMADEIAALNAIAKLEAETSMLMPMLASPTDFIKAAQRRLRELNGVNSLNLVTPEIGEIALARLADGYSNQQVAMIIGCAASTVSLIKTRRYRYSSLPASAKHGARGR